MSDASSHKRQRTAADHVVIDCGGTMFKSSISTLTSSCTYFASLFSREWEGVPHGEADIYLDRDPDAFKVMLSCLRNNVVLLPESDPDLCKRVLLEAEFLGVEWFLREVKCQSMRHCGAGPGWDAPWTKESQELLADPERASAKFDELFGGLRSAVQTGMLPSRYFRKPNPPSVESQTKIQQLLPAPQGDRVIFNDGGEAVASARPVAYALVEESNGHQYMDAVIVSRHPRAFTSFNSHDQQLMLASEFIEKRRDWDNHDWGIIQHEEDDNGDDTEAAGGLSGDMPGFTWDGMRWV